TRLKLSWCGGPFRPPPAASQRQAGAGDQRLADIVPDLLLDDHAVPQPEAIGESDALEALSVVPLAIERSRKHDGFEPFLVARNAECVRIPLFDEPVSPRPVRENLIKGREAAVSRIDGL